MFRGKSVRCARERQKGKGERGLAPRQRPFAFYLLPFALLTLALAGGCRQKMANQARYDPLEASDFFADGMSARPRVAGTVARGEITNDPFFDSGKRNGVVADGFPMPVTLDLINRGHDRFDIYCAQCHGRVGDGNGMIPSRGYRRPPSFHTEPLRKATSGHFFDVMTNGFGAMPPYRSQVSPQDRWAIAAYIRALQLSQSGTINDVPAAERVKLTAPASATPASAPATQGGHH